MTETKLGARLITLDGNIGVGKTTFVRPFAERNGYYLAEEPVYDNPYLERFYADPGRWAYEMETWSLGERIDVYLEALELINEGRNVIVERTHHSCMVFAKNCWRNGWITDKQFSEYSQVFHSLNNLLPTPDALLFLKASVDTCHDRMLRRGRECEAGVTKDYLRCVERYMEEMTEDIASGGTKVITLDWEDFGPDESEVVGTLSEIPSGFHGWMARVNGRDVYIPEIVRTVSQAGQDQLNRGSRTPGLVMVPRISGLAVTLPDISPTTVSPTETVSGIIFSLFSRVCSHL